MALQQVYMVVASATGVAYANMNISVRVQSSDAPGKIYRQVNATRYDFVRYEMTTTDGAGQVNFWTEDGTTYTFRVFDPASGALVDQLFDIQAGVRTPLVPTQSTQQATLNLVTEDEANRLANYYGIFSSSGADVSAQFQAYHDDVFDRGGSYIRLPRMSLSIHDINWHPAMSLYGANRFGTQIYSSVGTAATIRVLARTQSDANTMGWEPVFQDFSINGQASTQSVAIDGILFEAASLDPDYASHTGTAPYSSGCIQNVLIENVSGNGINVNTGRHRFYTENTRASGAYLHNISLQGGNDHVISERCDFTGSRLHSAYVQTSTGLIIQGAKFGGAGTYRSNNAVALHLQDVNSTTIYNNIFQDTVNIQGTAGTDRGVTLGGNDFRPATSVFSADGVPVGTADATFNAFVRVQGNDMVTVANNSYYAATNGDRFLNVASLVSNARAHFSIVGSSESGEQGWTTTNPVPISVEAGSFCTVDLKDIYGQSQRFTGQVQLGLTNSETIPTGSFGAVIGNSLPVLLGGNTAFAKAKQLLDASSFIIHTIVEGETYVIPDTAQIVVFESASAITTFNLKLPANPGFNSLYGNHLIIEFKQHVSALVLTANTNQTIRVVNGLGQPGTANIDQRMEWVFRSPSSTWEWVAGTTGTNTFTGSDFGNSLLNTANASTARTALGLGTAALNNTGDFTPIAHATDTTNPHQVTATQVGLGNVNNTSDANKPVSTATQTALNLKVNSSAFSSFGLSWVGYADAPTARTNLGLGTAATYASTAFAPVAHVTDYTNPHQVTKAQVGLANVDNTSDVNKPISTATAAALANKVGTNAFTSYSYTLVNASTAAGARSVLGLGTAALNNTGDFTPIEHSTNYYNPHQVTAAQVGLGNVNNTSDASKPVSVATQTALNLKVDASTFTVYGTGLVGMANAALARSYLALGTSATYNVPVSGNAALSQVVIGSDTRLSDARTPLSHTQAWSTITGTPTTLNGYGITDAAPLSHVTNYSNPHQVTKAQLTLGNVDNTADINKPISNAVSAALFNKINVSDANLLYTPIAHSTNYFNPHQVTKAQVGLGNVDNTADIDKPISTAVQAALDEVGNLSGATPFGVSLVESDSAPPAKALLVLDQVDNVSDVNKPLSLASTTALFGKLNVADGLNVYAPYAHVGNVFNPHNVTAAQVGLSNVNNTSDLNKPISTLTSAALALKTAAADLLSTSSNTLGSALVGHNATKNYVAGSIGWRENLQVFVDDFPWNAKGDWNGSTGTDDTAAIQAAEAFLESKGVNGELVFTRRYKISSPINVASDGIRWRGQGNRRNFQVEIHNANTSGADAVFFGDITQTSSDSAHFNSVGISNMAITGNSSSGRGIEVYNCSIYVHNVYTSNHGSNGFYINKGWGSHFDGLCTQANGADGFFSVTALNAVTFINCAFLSHPGKIGCHIHGGVAGNNSLLFVNPDCEGNAIGIYLNTSDGVIKDTHFISGDYEANTTSGIAQNNTGNITGLSITGGTYYGTGNGITLNTVYNGRITVPALYNCNIDCSNNQGLVVDNPRLEGTATVNAGYVTTPTIPATISTLPDQTFFHAVNTRNPIASKIAGAAAYYEPVLYKKFTSSSATPTINVDMSVCNFADIVLTGVVTALTITVSNDTSIAGGPMTFRLQNQSTGTGTLTLPGNYRTSVTNLVANKYYTLNFHKDDGANFIQSSQALV